MTQAVNWAIEPAHTHIGFSVRHLGLSSTPGVFKRFQAQLEYEDDNLEATRLRFEVEVASIDTAFALRDAHLRGPDWFAVEQHPKAIFVSHRVRQHGQRLAVEGELTLRGITLPLTLEARLTGRATNPWTQAPVCGFEASGNISRSAYGMGAFPGALSDEVQLQLQVEISPEIKMNQ